MRCYKPLPLFLKKKKYIWHICVFCAIFCSLLYTTLLFLHHKGPQQGLSTLVQCKLLSCREEQLLWYTCSSNMHSGLQLAHDLTEQRCNPLVGFCQVSSRITERNLTEEQQNLWIPLIKWASALSSSTLSKQALCNTTGVSEDFSSKTHNVSLN